MAKLIDPDGTRSHTLAPGTLYFLPTETTSTRTQYGKPADVFSLGCVMIHLMTHEWQNLQLKHIMMKSYRGKGLFCQK